MKFDKFRRDVCDIMIMVLLFAGFADSFMFAISDDHAECGSKTAMFILITLFLIAERQRADNRYKEYRKRGKR